MRTPLAIGMVQALPTARRRPTHSITRPATRVTRPDTCIGSTKLTSESQSRRYDFQRAVCLSLSARPAA
jgi:hypothetical protein